MSRRRRRRSQGVRWAGGAADAGAPPAPSVAMRCAHGGEGGTTSCPAGQLAAWLTLHSFQSWQPTMKGMAEQRLIRSSIHSMCMRRKVRQDASAGLVSAVRGGEGGWVFGWRLAWEGEDRRADCHRCRRRPVGMLYPTQRAGSHGGRQQLTAGIRHVNRRMSTAHVHACSGERGMWARSGRSGGRRRRM